MKILLCFILFSMLNVSGSIFSQNATFDLAVNGKTVKEVFKDIESQSDFRFLYNDDFTGLSRIVSFNTKDRNIDEVLNELLVGAHLTYRELENDLIVITPLISYQQDRVITGIVNDQNGVPLPGVTVTVRETSIGAVTNVDGSYHLEVPANAEYLRYSFVGMLSQDILIGDQQTINVTLTEDLIGLEEVIVVGYGTMRKVNLTGAIGSVAAEKLEGVPSSSVTSALQGRLPGVTITHTSGQPGRENYSIRIRGIGTMNDSSPMILVDGLETSLDHVNPSDIESISVLKDASSASIYGTRAANGVILITTKRGIAGESRVNYSGYVGYQQQIRNKDRLSSADYAMLLNEGRRNENRPEAYTQEEVDKFRDGSDPWNYPNTNWQKLVLSENGFTQDHNLSISGGSELLQYMSSLAYYNQEGLVQKTNHDRYSLRLNLDSQVKPWLKFGLNSNFSRREIMQPTSAAQDADDAAGAAFSGILVNANRIPNTFLNKYEDGSWARHIDGNPMAMIEGGGWTSDYSKAIGSVFGEAQITEGLMFTAGAGVDYNFDEEKIHVTLIEYGDGTVQGPNWIEDFLTRQLTVTLQALLNYHKRIGDHNFRGLLGVSQESSEYKRNTAFRRNLPSNDLTELNAGSVVGWHNSGTLREQRIGSYFSRINYDFAGKYLFEANLRLDGSSKFPEDNRWGAFPSFSAGWRISDESFMQNHSDYINNILIRGSWGILGNHRTSDYQYIPLISLGQDYNFGGAVAPGAAQTSASNVNITWETTTEFNIGLDIHALDHKIIAQIDYYDRFTDDILTVVPVSTTYGLTAPTSNAGAMRNRGLEIQLGHLNKIGNLGYELNGFAAFNKNRVERYLNPTKGATIRMEGLPWNSYYGYEWIGIFQTDEEALSSPVHSPHVRAGDLMFKDQTGDGKIGPDDRVVLGNAMPNITFGFNINMNYKAFDLIAFFQGAADVHRRETWSYMWPLVNGANARQEHLDRTIVEDGRVVTQGFYPRTLIDLSHNRVMSSFEVMEADYLRLKNLQLGFTLPQRLLNRLSLNRARVYVSGQNLWTITKLIDEFDPETHDVQYPQVAFITTGFNINF